MLPDMHFYIGMQPNEFIQSFSTLASTQFSIEEPSEIGVGGRELTIVNFRSTTPSDFDGLGFQLIFDKSRTRVVEVEVRARRWGVDRSFPTLQQYVEAGRTMISPLLKEFNKAHGTRLRIFVRKLRIRPLPTKRTQLHFERFAGAVNKSVFHPNDWVRFYKLVASVRQELQVQSVETLLLGQGFCRKDAEELASLYEHLRNFKSMIRR